MDEIERLLAEPRPERFTVEISLAAGALDWACGFLDPEDRDGPGHEDVLAAIIEAAHEQGLSEAAEKPVREKAQALAARPQGRGVKGGSVTRPARRRRCGMDRSSIRLCCR